MDNKLELIKPHIRHFCKEGYLDDSQSQMLFDLAKQYNISQTAINDYVQEELQRVREKHIAFLYKESGQPDASLQDKPDLNKESIRKFPDMLNVGTLSLNLQKDVVAPAFVPIKGMSGISLVYDKTNKNDIYSLMQNIAIRLLLSIPKGLAKLNLFDISNMGASFINLSGLDEGLLHVLYDAKDIQPYLQQLNKEAGLFNFNQLGNKYTDINEYNKTNRSKARAFQIFLSSSIYDFKEPDKANELIKGLSLGAKSGMFFILAIEKGSLKGNLKLEEAIYENTTIIDENGGGYKIEADLELDLLNNFYTVHPVLKAIFDSDLIHKINNEYDPLKYKSELSSEKLISSDELMATVAKKLDDGKTNEYELKLGANNNNLLIVSDNKNDKDVLIKNLILNIADTYAENEVEFYINNSSVISYKETIPGLKKNIFSENLDYTLGLLKEIEDIVEARKTLFSKNSSIIDYSIYRQNNDEKLPRIVCLLDQTHFFLDSNEMIADEIIISLDLLLTTAQNYGVHFVVVADPKSIENLLKLDISTSFGTKIIHTSETNIIDILYPNDLLSDDNMNHLKEDNSALLYRLSENTGIKIKIEKKYADVARNWNDIESPIVMLDKENAYPKCYEGIKAISKDDNTPYIGIPRYYSTEFFSLDTSNNKLFLLYGCDYESLNSLVKSYRKNKILIYDAIKSTSIGSNHSSFLEFADEISQELSQTNDKDSLTIIMLNMDEEDYENKETVDTLKSTLSLISDEKVLLFFHSKGDSLFSESRLGELFRLNFSNKIYLKGANESISSQNLFLKKEIENLNSDFAALYEGVDINSNRLLHNFWFFKYE